MNTKYEFIIDKDYFNELFNGKIEFEFDSLTFFEETLYTYQGACDEEFDFDIETLDIESNDDTHIIFFECNKEINIKDFKFMFNEIIGKYNDKKIKVVTTKI